MGEDVGSAARDDAQRHVRANDARRDLADGAVAATGHDGVVAAGGDRLAYLGLCLLDAGRARAVDLRAGPAQGIHDRLGQGRPC